MKNLFSFLIISLVIFSSCKKDDDPTTAERLQYRWTFNNAVFTDFTTNPVSTFTQPGSPGDYIDFRSNGQAYSKIGGFTDSIPYSVLNDSFILLDGDSTQINTLTDTNLQLTTKYRGPAGNVEDQIVINLTK